MPRPDSQGGRSPRLGHRPGGELGEGVVQHARSARVQVANSAWASSSRRGRRGLRGDGRVQGRGDGELDAVSCVAGAR